MGKETGAFGWPKGSVRAFLALSIILCIAFKYFWTGEVNADMKDMGLLILGFYFGKNSK